MSKAVIARQKGDNFQALFFWLHAGKLWVPSSNLKKIEWESDNSLGFDDVVLHYHPFKLEGGDQILYECYQTKFHVDQRGGFSCQSLIDPDFIGTKDDTILKRLYKLYKKSTSAGNICRYIVVSTWGFEKDDYLRNLTNNSGALCIDKLFDGTTDRSAMGKVRKSWREHLGGITDDVLKKVIRPLRIRVNFQDFTTEQDYLNNSLARAGLKELDATCRASVYTDLIQKLHAEGKNIFTKEELHKICAQERLLAETSNGADDVQLIGIRSFIKGADDLELQVDDLLCLLHFFSGRYIQEDMSWQQIYPLISAFADNALQIKKHVHIHLDTHLSVAFCLGYCLNSKTGISLSLVQKTIAGRLVWTPEPDKIQSAPIDNWNWEERIQSDTVNDIVISISVTHSIHEEVQEYIEKNLTGISKIINASIKPGPSPYSIQNANHCVVSAQELVNKIKSSLTKTGGTDIVHLFVSAPNAFAFFLGRLSETMGKLVLYEFDFEKRKTGTYHPSISLPLL